MNRSIPPGGRRPLHVNREPDDRERVALTRASMNRSLTQSAAGRFKSTVNPTTVNASPWHGRRN